MIDVTEIRLYEDGVDDAVGNVAHEGVVVASSTEHGKLLHVVKRFRNGLGGLYLAPANPLETILVLVGAVNLVPRPLGKRYQPFGELAENLVVALLDRHPHVQVAEREKRAFQPRVVLPWLGRYWLRPVLGHRSQSVSGKTHASPPW